MRSGAIKITTAAVCTALAVMFCAMTAYLPLSIMPLYFAAFCIFLACKRGNLLYGTLTMLATVGIMFAMTGLSVKWLFLVFMFAPYGILTYFIHRFTYFKVKWAVVRVIIAILYFNLMLFLVYIVVINVLSIDRDFMLLNAVDKVGGYAVLALIATAVLVPLDFIFSTLGGIVLKRLPGGGGGKPRKATEEKTDDGRAYDIFGYAVDENKDSADKNEDVNKDE